MSIILDALRKVEREKEFARRQAMVLNRRVLAETAEASGGFFGGRSMEMLAVGGLLAFAGGFCFAAGMAGRGPLRPAAAEAMTRNETAVSVSTAVETGDVARQGGEEARAGVKPSAHMESLGAAYPMKKQEAGPRGVAGEVTSRETAGLSFSTPKKVITPRGIEPPASKTQAAPAPVFVLDGIVYHDDADKRSALMRVRGGESALLNIGGRLRGYTVSDITPSRVTLAAGGKEVELVLE